ncbi:hypothetical protein [Gracilimonas sp.]|uniref:hypothetical protein n=1 Tax=Gracilimonas sp. TaxID=1974203 RepID=UPI0028721583|nr:hypothetical protein [Gracilimonas sp.]
MNKIKLVALVLLLIGLSACLKDYSIPNFEDIEGVVLLNEEPVGNANIHVRHVFDPGGLLINNLEQISLDIQVQTSGEYVGNLFRYGENDPFSTFLDGRLSRGVNKISIPDSLLSNGIIGYEVSGDFGPISAGLLTMSRPDSLIPSMIPFTTTDESGAFVLESINLPFRESFSRSNGRNLVISDSLDIIVANEEEILKILRVKVEPKQANFFEINLD